jgi:hypothetical protein
MNSHLHAALAQSRLAEIEQGAERHRREAGYPSRARRIARIARTRRPQLSFRPAHRQA